jgi:Transglycosylase-like domain
MFTHRGFVNSMVSQTRTTVDNGRMFDAQTGQSPHRSTALSTAVVLFFVSALAYGVPSQANPDPTATAPGPTTTLLQIQLPGAATTKPAAKSKQRAKRTTTKKKRSKGTADVSSTISDDISISPATSVATSAGTSAVTSKPAPPSRPLKTAVPVVTDETSEGKVIVGKPKKTVPPGNGVDVSITTVLPPDQVPNDISDATWAALRECESHNNYEINTGNGYYGAYQFAAGTWKRLGYSGLPHRAAPVVQDEAAKRLQAKSGWGQWPACSRKLGLR